MAAAPRASTCDGVSRTVIVRVAGLRLTGMVAPMVLDGPINGDGFEAFAV
jgi:hypothetical protein